MEDSTAGIILILIVLHFVGGLIYRYYLPKIKGKRGENKVSRLLKKLDKVEYRHLDDLYLIANGKSTQIDHLIVSVYGIFVIETKNYKGWIHGHDNSEYWTQTIYKSKVKFRNPVKQNWSHIYFLKELLSKYPRVKYHPIIVFVVRGELKNVFSKIPVIYEYELLKTIKRYQEEILTTDQVNSIVSELSEFIVSEEKGKRQHKKHVKKSINERKNKVKEGVCPNCDGALVIRKGRHGRFYGCSNYPRCRFTTNV